MDKKLEPKNIDKLDNEINLDSLNLYDIIDNNKNSRWTTLYFKYQDFSANISTFFRKYPLIGYSFKRILYGILTLLLTITIVFFSVYLITEPEQFLPESFNKLGIEVGSEEYKTYIETRLKLYGLYGSPIKILLNYYKNIFPLIPKTIIVGKEINWYSSAIDFSKIDGKEEREQALNFYLAINCLETNITLDSLKEIVNMEDLKKYIDILNKNVFASSDSIKLVTKTSYVYFGLASSRAVGTPGSTEIWTLFKNAMPYSFGLGAIGIVISYFIGIPLGIEAARRKGRSRDTVINSISSVLIAAPALIIVLAIFLFSASLKQSIIFNSGSMWTRFWPIVAIIIFLTPEVIVLTRRFVIDEMSEEYIKFANAKGLSESAIFYRHIFRVASTKIIRNIPLDLTLVIFGASILIETQWQIPGMAPILVNSVSGVKDTFAILGYVTLASFAKIFSTLVSDLCLVLMDPRIKLTK